MRKIVQLAVSILILASCDPGSRGDPVTLRLSFQTLNAQGTEAKVILEGSDGNLITGSTVIVSTTDDAVKILDFSFSEGSYHGFVPVSSDGMYTVEVISRLLEQPLSQSVEHHVLAGKPQLTVLRDDSGNSALSGNPIKTGDTILSAWSSVPHATVYQISIVRDGKTVYTGSSAEASATVPSGTCSSPGSYSMSVTAQYIAGDPFLKKNNFYSFSEKTGSSILFITE